MDEKRYLISDAAKVVQAESKDRRIPDTDERYDRSDIQPMAKCHEAQHDDLFGDAKEPRTGIPLPGLHRGISTAQIIDDDKNKQPFNRVIDRAKKKGAQGSQNPANRQKNAG